MTVQQMESLVLLLDGFEILLNHKVYDVILCISMKALLMDEPTGEPVDRQTDQLIEMR